MVVKGSVLVTLNCLVPLSKGMKATVSPEDFPKAMRSRWHTLRGYRTYYASGQVRGVKGKVYLHRYLMDAKSGLVVDHKNGNGLDCTRGNMRLATHSQNHHNTGSSQGSTSRFKGVMWDTERKQWRASIRLGAKQLRYIGRFRSEEAAARAYDAAAKELHGEFARLNFPGEVAAYAGQDERFPDGGARAAKAWRRANRVPEPKGAK